MAGAPSTFTRVINNVLLGLGETMCLIFMDDILLFSKTIEKHANRLRTVLGRLREAKFTLNLAKCHFAQDRVEYLGFLVTSEAVMPSEEKLTAIHTFPRPRTVRDMRSFLGLSGYYRQFIPRYAELA